MDPRKAVPLDDPAAAGGHDAQRALEQRALRNVRSLLDKLEGREKTRQRSSWKLLAWLLVGMGIALVVGYAMLRTVQGPGQTRVITTQPAKAPDTPR